MGALVTILPEKPFLETLAAYVLREYGQQPETLCRVLVLLPTRRACRSFQDALLEKAGGKPMLLPRIQPIGDMEEESSFSLEIPDSQIEALGEALPPVIHPLKRLLYLTRLVAKFEGGGQGPYSVLQHINLAVELARFFNNAARENLDFKHLQTLAPEEFAVHWQKTLRFLEIVTHYWPELLKEQGAQDPVERRNALIERLAAHWLQKPPAHPVIMAGSTASQHATAMLLQAVVNSPHGLAVLPGYDVELSQQAWEILDETHPQFGFKVLFNRLHINRETVSVLDMHNVAASCNTQRIQLLYEALRPQELTHTWRECGINPVFALKGVTRLEAASQQEEARLIGIALRQALETPGKTAAVVTRDRTLARIISATMERYGITIDDSAGKPLRDTVAGHLLCLIAECAMAKAAPVPLLAMLKHPLTCLGLEPLTCKLAIWDLELTALRGGRLKPGLNALSTHVAQHEVSAHLHAFATTLEHMAEPFFSFFSRKNIAFADMLAAHIALAESMAATDIMTGSENLWHSEENEALRVFLTDLREHADTLGYIDPAAYTALFTTLIQQEVYRPTAGLHARLRIYSPQEARLERADVMVIAGLNEGVWPPAAEASPWMSRPMQRRFGLPLPEVSISRSAHDMLMIAGASEIILTRAAKTDGSPTIPSRWLLRLDTMLNAMEGEQPFAWDIPPYAAWAHRLETPEKLPPFQPPAPTPPVHSRPRALPVTQIETWQRDPYSIYARYVLGLKVLDPLDQEPDAAEFGSLIHSALELFVKDYPVALPANALEELISRGKRIFQPVMDHPAVQGFWWPRYMAIATWVADKEFERRPALKHVEAERKAKMHMDAPNGAFTLITRIDRMEWLNDKSVRLIDYKTGTVPKPADIASGLSSQMPLEALVLMRGADKINITEAEYWKLKGETTLNEVKTVGQGVKETSPTLETLITRAEEGVLALISAFDEQQTPYLACPDPARKPHYNDYEYLERLAEWAEG